MLADEVGLDALPTTKYWKVPTAPSARTRVSSSLAMTLSRRRERARGGRQTHPAPHRHSGPFELERGVRPVTRPPGSAMRSREVEAGGQLEVVAPRAARRRRGSRRTARRRRSARRPGSPRARTARRRAAGRASSTSIVRSIAVEHLEQLAPRARVEVRRRLVEHEQRAGASRAPSRSPRAGARPSRAGAARASAASVHPHGRRAPRRRARATSARSSPRFSGPKATSSRTVGMNSWSSGSWNTSPTRARSSCSVSPPTSSPATSSSPSPRSRPLRWSISVVLPAPLGPSTATRSPCSTCRSTPRERRLPVG